MKKLISTFAISSFFLISVGTALAAPKANNPQVVANYSTGDHGIVGEPDTHTGADVVMTAGKSGNFQQWFKGTSTENGGITEGDHSVWMNVGSRTSCPNGWDFVSSPYPAWGSYLQPGANYCVHTNDFNSSTKGGI